MAYSRIEFPKNLEGKPDCDRGRRNQCKRQEKEEEEDCIFSVHEIFTGWALRCQAEAKATPGRLFITGSCSLPAA